MQRDAFGRVPLHHAIINRQRDCIQMLLSDRDSVEVADVTGRTALHYAVIVDDVATVQGILGQLGPTMSTFWMDFSGYTAGHLAVLVRSPLDARTYTRSVIWVSCACKTYLALEIGQLHSHNQAVHHGCRQVIG
jgi:Ankyrin repeats (3 copies)